MWWLLGPTLSICEGMGVIGATLQSIDCCNAATALSTLTGAQQVLSKQVSHQLQCMQATYSPLYLGITILCTASLYGTAGHMSTYQLAQSHKAVGAGVRPDPFSDPCHDGSRTTCFVTSGWTATLMQACLNKLLHAFPTATLVHLCLHKITDLHKQHIQVLLLAGVLLSMQPNGTPGFLDGFIQCQA